jgi:hypothetical protein
MQLVDVLFETLLSRYSLEDTWELRLDRRPQADLLYSLASTVVLLPQINEAEAVNRRARDGSYDLTYPILSTTTRLVTSSLSSSNTARACGTGRGATTCPPSTSSTASSSSRSSVCCSTWTTTRPRTASLCRQWTYLWCTDSVVHSPPSHGCSATTQRCCRGTRILNVPRWESSCTVICGVADTRLTWRSSEPTCGGCARPLQSWPRGRWVSDKFATH